VTVVLAANDLLRKEAMFGLLKQYIQRAQFRVFLKTGFRLNRRYRALKCDFTEWNLGFDLWPL